MPKVTREVLLENLKAGSCLVNFHKISDGTERNMVCTLSPGLVPSHVKKPADMEEPGFFAQEGPSKKPDNPNLIVVWDLEKHGWRSFRVDTVESATFFPSPNRV